MLVVGSAATQFAVGTDTVAITRGRLGVDVIVGV